MYKTSSYPFICLWTFRFFHVLGIVNNATVSMKCRHPFDILFSFSLEKYPEVGLLNYMIVLFLTF